MSALGPSEPLVLLLVEKRKKYKKKEMIRLEPRLRKHKCLSGEKTDNNIFLWGEGTMGIYFMYISL